MKKLLAGLLVVCFLVIPQVCFSQGDTHSQVIYTEIIESGADSAATVIPVTKIRPDVDKIIGMQVFCLGPAFGTAALYDSTTTSMSSSTEVICEYEATSGQQSNSIFFPFPRTITEGIVIVQDALTRVIVYYVRQ